MTKLLARWITKFRVWSGAGSKYFDRSQAPKQNYWLHGVLLLVTFATTALTGLFWLNLWVPFRSDLDFSLIFMGFPYAVALMTIIGCHEFGHYFAALYHRIKVSLPYFIPYPPWSPSLNVGTFGAVIRLHQAIKNNRQLLDIGAYGPFTGFIASLLILLMGVMTLPTVDYIYTIHPNYRFLSEIPSPLVSPNGDLLILGENLIFRILTDYFLPYSIPMSEIYHYPLLLAGWFGLFFTAMNLMPFGQLDGGHIVYAVFGEKIHRMTSYLTLAACFLLGFYGLIKIFMGQFDGSQIVVLWLIWGAVLLLIVKPWHPPVDQFMPLNKRRLLMALINLIILLFCFNPIPFVLV